MTKMILCWIFAGAVILPVAGFVAVLAIEAWHEFSYVWKKKRGGK